MWVPLADLCRVDTQSEIAQPDTITRLKQRYLQLYVIANYLVRLCWIYTLYIRFRYLAGILLHFVRDSVDHNCTQLHTAPAAPISRGTITGLLAISLIMCSAAQRVLYTPIDKAAHGVVVKQPYWFCHYSSTTVCPLSSPTPSSPTPRLHTPQISAKRTETSKSKQFVLNVKNKLYSYYANWTTEIIYTSEFPRTTMSCCDLVGVVFLNRKYISLVQFLKCIQTGNHHHRSDVAFLGE